jgi:hypothetical protein
LITRWSILLAWFLSFHVTLKNAFSNCASFTMVIMPSKWLFHVPAFVKTFYNNV